MSRKEVFSIPNILSYTRILLIPLFMYIYFGAESQRDYYAAALVVAVSAFTDMFDGAVARRFGMVTELGKVLDPLADKLTQGALIICFLGRWPIMRAMLAVYILKEGFMAVMSLAVLRHNGQKLDGAMMHGKICTAVLFVSMIALLLLPGLAVEVVDIIVLLDIVAMMLSFLLYVPVFVRMYNKETS